MNLFYKKCEKHIIMLNNNKNNVVSLFCVFKMKGMDLKGRCCFVLLLFSGKNLMTDKREDSTRTSFKWKD